MWSRLLWIAAVAAAAPAAAVELAAGDILLLDTGIDAVLRIDPESGDREIVTSNEVGAGGRFLHPTDLVWAGDGAFLVVDRNAYVIFRVDPRSGDRSAVLEGEAARRLGSLRSIARGQDGGYWLGRSGRRAAIYGLDASLRESRELRPRLPPQQALRNPVAFVPDGPRLLVADSQRGVLEIERESGEVRRLARVRREGSPLQEPFDMVRAADGSLWVADKGGKTLLRLDPASGDATIVSGAGVGQGEPLRWPSGLALEADGRVLLADRLAGSVFRIDPDTGERRVLSSAEVGRGPGPRTPRRLLVVPGEAPRRLWPALATGAALLVGGIAWLGLRR